MLFGSRPLEAAGFLSGSGSSTLNIDATGMTDAGPLDATGIVAIAHWAAAAAIRVILDMPEDEKVGAYLRAMEVVDLMPPSATARGSSLPDRRDHPVGVLKVTALSPENFDDLAKRLGRLLSEFYPDRSAANAVVFRACSELMGNAIEHGHSDLGAFIAAQAYPATASQGRRLEFAVCDTGIGVMEHLRLNPDYAHLTRDKVAIKKALKPGVSGIAGDLRGNGLSDAVEDSRHEGDVELQIRSGGGEVRVTASPTRRHERDLDRPDQTSGTWAWLLHQLPSPVQTAVQS